MEIEEITADLLVIGAGLAGIRAAEAAVCMGLSVVMAGKGMCASPEVMGFNAAVNKPDSVEQYYQDIRVSGRFINVPEVARVLAEGAAGEVAFLEGYGVEFDKAHDGTYSCLQTLGSRYPRLVHSRALTGIEAMRVLYDSAIEKGVRVFEPVMMIELLQNANRVQGALGLCMRSGRLLLFRCKAIVLAAGGCGDIYAVTTYPGGISGDGYALAYRAGAQLIDMEFQQYEPCCFVYPEVLRGKLVPTTLLRAGAKLFNAEKTEFMANYGLNAGNAQKGELSRAIAAEIAEGRGTPHGGVYYDMTMLPRDLVAEGHSIFYIPALNAGLDLLKTPAEMAPAAHTCLGGVRIDADGRTSVKGLFAAGEVTGGIHGANRIGGCAGAETLVFGGRAGKAAAQFALEQDALPAAELLGAKAREVCDTLQKRLSVQTAYSANDIGERIRKVMLKKAGIIRNGTTLQQALIEIETMEEQLQYAGVQDDSGFPTWYACRNMLTTAKLQVMASLVRKESRGVFFREDYPLQDDKNWTRNVVLQQKNGQVSVCIA